MAYEIIPGAAPVVPAAAPVVAAAAAPAVAAPVIPATADRQSVPASAMFSDEELTPNPGDVPAGDKPADTTAADKVAADKVAADKVAADKVAADKVAADKVAADKAAIANEPKIKVGDKEYTKAELEAALKKRTEEKTAPVAPAAAPAAPAAKTPTPEEITAQENTWTANFIKNEKLNFAFSPEEVETMLTGGDDAAKLLSAKLNDVAAKAVMLARKSIFADMNPVIGRLHSNMEPVVQNSQQVEAAAAEAQFFSAYPEFTAHKDTVLQIGQALLQRFPAEMAAMTREQQLAEVAAQSNAAIQAEYAKWNPAATGTWRDAVKPAAPAAPAAPALVAPAAAPAAPAAKILPPGGNSPAATPSGGADPGFHKSVAKDLQS